MPRVLDAEEKMRRANWARSCAACSKIFGWAKNGDAAMYCSRRCCGIGVGNAPKPVEKLTAYVCLQCKAPFDSYHKRRKFCSRRCAGQSRKGVSVHYATGAKDQNHDEIVAALVAASVSIIDTSGIGNGMPDLIVGFGARTGLLEIKNPKNSYGRKGFNHNQRRWLAEWKGGPVAIVTDVEGALRFARMLAFD